VGRVGHLALSGPKRLAASPRDSHAAAASRLEAFPVWRGNLVSIQIYPPSYIYICDTPRLTKVFRV
jgi:hypothetical protein